MPLTLIDRYLLREIVQTWGAVTAVLLLVLLTNSLAYMLGNVIQGELPVDALLPLFLTNVTGYIVTLVPLGLYLGLLLAFGRLYADSEMAALGACGVGLARLYRPVMIAGLIAALVTAALTVWVSPWAKRIEHDIQARMEARSALAGIAPGRFNRARGGAVVLFAEGRDATGRLHEVFVETRDEAGVAHIVRARSAIVRTDPDTGWRFLEFQNGYRYTGRPGTAEFRVVAFEEYGVRVPRPSVESGEIGREGQSLTALWHSDNPKAAAELQWRISLPLACLLLALAALPLSHTTPRKGRYGRIAGALLIYLVYSNVLVFARDAVAEGTVPPAVGMWWAHALTLALVLALVAHRVGWRWSRDLLIRRPEFRS